MDLFSGNNPLMMAIFSEDSDDQFEFHNCQVCNKIIVIDETGELCPENNKPICKHAFKNGCQHKIKQFEDWKRKMHKSVVTRENKCRTTIVNKK